MRKCLAPFLHELGECGCPAASAARGTVQIAGVQESCRYPALAEAGVCDCAACARELGTLESVCGDRGVANPRSSSVEVPPLSPAAAVVSLAPPCDPPETTAAGRTYLAPIALSWSEYAAELERRGAAALEDEHGLWCPADCACGFTLPEEVELANPLLGLVRGIVDPRVAAMFLAADDADRMLGSLHEFLKGCWHELEPATTFEDGEAIEAVCDHLQNQLEERAIAVGLMVRPAGWVRMRAQNLLIRVPPRSLKTVIATIAATAWAWLRWPTMRILSLSSNPRVTSEGADRFRSLVRSDWYQRTFKPQWRIREDMDALTKIGNTAGGWRAARGMTSRITGEGADWLLIDDPHDGAEVYSKAKRGAVNDKWRRSTSNRVNDPRYAIRTGVMQALHFDDWGQHRISDGWGLLLIRMEYEASGKARKVGERTLEPDSMRVSPYGWRDWRRVEGQTIHPRFTDEWRAQEKKDKGPLDWAAQYQQDPAPIDGGIVRDSDLCTYEDLPERLDGWAITVDAAFKKNTGATNSRVSVQVWARRGPDRFLVDNETAGMHMQDTEDAIERMRVKWPQAAALILVEDKANGSEIIRRLRERFPGIVDVNPGNNSKESRLYACQSYFVGRNIYLPKYAPWIEDFRAEVTQFPNWPRDDQVDAMVQLLLYWRLNSAAARARAGCTL